MIKQLSVCSFALFLVACDPNKENPIIPGSPQGASSENKADTSSIVKDAQARISSTCKYVAAAQPLLKILLKSIPGLSTASEIADAVCKAVVASEASPGAKSVPTVAGVPIRGQFAR